MGSGIGDRLAEALINLPLKRQAAAAQLLEQRVAIGQKQQQFGLEQARAHAQDIHYGAEHDHWLNQDAIAAKRVQSSQEQGKEKAHATYLQNVVKNDLDNRKFDEEKSYHTAEIKNAGDRIAAEHVEKGLQHQATMRHVEFGGKTAGEIARMKPEDLEMLPPEQKKAWSDYLNALKTGAAEEQKTGAQQIPAREVPLESIGDALGAPGQQQKIQPQVRVSSESERDALPPGTQYVDPQGNVRVKQGNQASAPVQPSSQAQGIGAALQPKLQQPTPTAIPETWQHEEYAKYRQQQEQQAAVQRQQQIAADAVKEQRQFQSDQTVASSKELDQVAQALQYGGPDDETVVRYLSQFTPQQRAVQLRVLQQRVESFRSQQ
jgi:hypothetical protein